MTLSSHDAGALSRPLATPAQARPHIPAREAVLKRLRIGDRYFVFLCLVLAGYALGGRGFAYWGVNPLFIGEIALMVGVVVMYRIGVMGKVIGLRLFMPLILFMCLGLIATVPYIDKYQKDAIRDAVTWGYGTYAFIIASLLISDPTRLQKMVIYYRKFVFWFLIIAPFTSVISSYFDIIPAFPGTGVPLIQVKGGDLCVHIAGCFSYIVALGAGMNPWFTSLLIPLNLGLNMNGRGAMLAFCTAGGIAAVLRPFNARALRIFFVLALGLFFLWATDFKVAKGEREMSFNGIIKNFGSIAGDTDDDALSGSKVWRLNWWHDIVQYTVYGKYFWTGKGFGINLASDDGYQTDEDEALRSPHSGHMTMLARMGVPGFCAWILVQGTWALVMVEAYLRAARNRHVNWSGVFMFLGSYWAAILANASFDVYIEGPMGGIWLWNIYGAGIACVYLYRRYPDLLTPAPALPPLAVPARSHRR